MACKFYIMIVWLLYVKFQIYKPLQMLGWHRRLAVYSQNFQNWSLYKYQPYIHRPAPFSPSHPPFWMFTDLGTELHSTTLHSQYSAIQYSTVQYSTVQCCTVHLLVCTVVQNTVAHTHAYTTWLLHFSCLHWTWKRLPNVFFNCICFLSISFQCMPWQNYCLPATVL